jgi:hypothetical protein
MMRYLLANILVGFKDREQEELEKAQFPVPS